MIRENKFNQYGYPRGVEDILGITIHESNNINMNANDYFNYYDNESKDNKCFHYICDGNSTIQIMPNDWAVYHTGKGYDWGNRFTIAILLCESLNDDILENTINNCINLIKQLQKEYNIPNNMIYFHNDWDIKNYCPKTLMDKYGTSMNFVYQKLKEE